MAGECLLDTNTVIALFRKEQTALARAADADEIFISSTVLGELYYGAERARRVEESYEEIAAFVAGVAVLGCDDGTAREYGRIKGQLRKLGQMIPENDIWIAAIALQHSLPLVTQDQHFTNVPGLRVTAW